MNKQDAPSEEEVEETSGEEKEEADIDKEDINPVKQPTESFYQSNTKINLHIGLYNGFIPYMCSKHFRLT